MRQTADYKVPTFPDDRAYTDRPGKDHTARKHSDRSNVGENMFCAWRVAGTVLCKREHPTRPDCGADRDCRDMVRAEAGRT